MYKILWTIKNKV